MRPAIALGTALTIACGDAGGGADAASASEQARARERDQQFFDRVRKPEVVVRALGLEPGMTVADVGAGSGLLTLHLARAVAPEGRVVATDIDGTALDRLHARMEAGGVAHLVEGRRVKPDDRGLEHGRYDAILLAQVDHLLADRVAWLTRARSALGPQGRLAIANLVHHRAAALAAADSAGFKLVGGNADVPGQFVAVFEVKP